MRFRTMVLLRSTRESKRRPSTHQRRLSIENIAVGERNASNVIPFFSLLEVYLHEMRLLITYTAILYSF